MGKNFNWNKWTRKTHYWGAFIILLPVLIISITCIFLQLKKEIYWIQPPTVSGDLPNNPSISFEEILEAAKTVKETNIESWNDIDRLDVRIDKGIVKVRTKNRWEVQIDTYSGEVVQVAYRRSDIIEELHDGSWFHENVKLLIFLPSGIILFLLWITGFYMVLIPYLSKWKKRKSIK
jgi:uncharacterized iron-regulated membrane protein